MSMKRFIVEVDHEKTIWMDWNWNIHREGDLPAVSFPDGHKEYWEHGKLHREVGPAIIKSDGTCFYYHKGEEYYPEK